MPLSEIRCHSSGSNGRETFGGDTVWRREVGFGRVEEEVPIDLGARLKIYLRDSTKTVLVVATYYTNLPLAAARDHKLGTLLASIAGLGNQLLAPAVVQTAGSHGPSLHLTEARFLVR